MKLETFHLDEWLDQYGPTVRYDLAASTGPSWTLDGLRALMTEEEEARLFGTPLLYCPGHGGGSLRHEIASMYGAADEEVLVVAGASEALLALFFLAAGTKRGSANVVVPDPVFPPVRNVPESLGLEVRGYPVDAGPDRIESLVDEGTRIVFVNSPHNPTGSVFPEESIGALDRFTSERGVMLVVDEVYHPIYHGPAHRSAGEYSGATVLGDMSKAFCLSGLRIGWILERDPDRRRQYWNARAHFSISNNFPGELLAEVAVKNRDRIFARAQDVAARNLAILDELFLRHEDRLDWARPRGGTTAFPRLRSGEDARPFCRAAAEHGVLLAPGDAFSHPSHFRLGFGACADGFEDAVSIVEDLLN